MLSALVVLLAAMTMVVLATVMGLVLGWANRAFHVYVDPRVEAINIALPGVNCGGCGCIGCNEFAEAVVAGEAAVNGCTVGGVSVAEAVAGILGVEVEETWPYRAVVHCAASTEQRLGRSEYRGEPTCAAASSWNGSR